MEATYFGFCNPDCLRKGQRAGGFKLLDTNSKPLWFLTVPELD